MASLRKFSVLLFALALFAGLGAAPAHAAVTFSCNIPATMTTGTAYSFTCTAVGGTGNYQWTVLGLPGLSYSGASTATLTIFGTPVAAQSYTIYVQVNDGQTAPSQSFSGTISGSGGGGGAINITSLSPSTAVVGTSFPLTVVGTGFSSTSYVVFNNVVIPQNAGTLTASSLTVTVPASAIPSAGSFLVYVVDGTSQSNYLNFSATLATGPSLSSINPQTTAAGGPGFNLSLTGSGFGQGMLVTFGAFTTSVTPTSSTTATVYIPNSWILTAGQVYVTVGGNTASQQLFTITSSSTGGLTISCNPTSGPVVLNASYTQTCTVSGGVAPYFWNTVSGLPTGLSQSSQSGSNQLTITGVPTVAGSYTYTISASDSTPNTHLIGTLLINGAITSSGTGALTLSSLLPNTAQVNSGSFTMALNGTGFTSPATVSFSGQQLTASVASPTSATVTVPASFLAYVQTYNVTVTANGVTSNSVPFYVTGASTGGSLSLNCSPGYGPAAVGTAFTATCNASGGSGAYNWTTSTLPGYLALSATTGSSVTISGTPSYIGPYSYTVKVTDNSNQSSATLQFAGYVNLTSSGYSSTISSISPSSGAVNTPVTLTITGAGFPSNALVNFNSFPAMPTTNTGSQLVVSIPANWVGNTNNIALPVYVTSPNGNSNTVYYNVGNPGSGALSLNCNPGTGPGSVGAYYSTTCGVSGGTPPYTWSTTGGVPAGISLASTTGVTVTVQGTPTSGTAYSYSVQVQDSSPSPNTTSLLFAGTTSGGSGSSGVTITGLSPTSAQAGSTQPVPLTVTGTGFSGGSQVYFGTTQLNTTYVSSTTLTAMIPVSSLATAGLVNVTVNTGGVSSNPVTFTVGSGTGGVFVTCNPNVGPIASGSYYTSMCTANGGKAPYSWALGGTSNPGLGLTNTTGTSTTVQGFVFFQFSQYYSYTLTMTDSSTPANTVTLPFTGVASARGGITITNLSATSAPLNSPNVNLTITGAGYDATASVQWAPPSPISTTNPNPVLPLLNTVYVSPNTITTTIPANYLTGSGTAFLQVTAAGGISNVVAFTIGNGTPVNITPASLAFTYVMGGTTPPAQTLTITSATATGYSVTTSTATGGNWLAPAAPSGVIPGTLSVGVNPGGLAVGSYTGSVQITGFGVGSPTTVPVTLTVTAPGTISVSTSSLTFTSPVNGANPAAQTFNVTASSGSGVAYTVATATTTGGNWLTATTSGTTPGTVSVSINNSGLVAGTYNGTVTVTAPGATNGSQTVAVTLTVTPPPAALTLSPTTLTFNAAVGGSAPPSQTVSLSASGNAAIPYSAAATTSTGGNWLSVSPTSGNTPGTITASVNPSGLTIGSYTGTITITSSGASNSPQTVTVNLTVSNPSTLAIAPASLTFNLPPGGASAVAPQSVSVFAGTATPSFTVTTSTTAGGNWLTATGATSAPGSILVSVNAGMLTAGNIFTGSVKITSPTSNPSTVSIPVTVNVPSAANPKMLVAPANVLLSYTQGASTDEQRIGVLNAGGGTLNFSATAQTTSCSGWLTLLNSSGTATPSVPGVIGFMVNPSGSSQTCRGTITVTDGSGNTTVVPVSMAISAQSQAIQLSQTAMTFQAAPNGPATASQSFQVLNPGFPALPWTISSHVLTGGNWLTVTPTSGTAQPQGAAGTPVVVSVNPQGLSSGTYYGTIQVLAAGANNSPQTLTVTLIVTAAGTSPSPIASPNGVIITGSGTTADTQTVSISNPGTGTVSFTSTSIADDGGNWLSVTPANGSIAAGASTSLSLTANMSGLSAGRRHATLRIGFSDGSVQTVDVTLAISGTASTLAAGVATCGSSDLAVELQSPAQNFLVNARVGVPLLLLVKDCAGNAVSNVGGTADVLINGTTDIRLTYAGSGLWSGVWTPSVATPSVTLAAYALALKGTGVAAGASGATGVVMAAPSPAPPYVAAVLNAASFQLPGLVAPLGMVSIFGSGLADSQQSVYSVPFPTTLAGAQLMIGGQALPLFYASDGQINAIVPTAIAANEHDQLIVVRDTTQSAPADLLVADNNPGIFTFNQSGSGQGAILNAVSGALAAPAGTAPGSAPVTAGNYVSIYLSSLGAVSNPPADGNPAGSNSTTNLTPTVTIGGAPAAVSYSGLAPGEVGVYQINAIVPASVTGGAVPVVVTLGNGISNTVTIAIQ
jgi:uncharacterized protein (TIGR03437 family)